MTGLCSAESQSHKDKLSLQKCSRIKVAKELRPLKRDSGLEKQRCYKGQYWNNWQNGNKDHKTDDNITSK